MLKFLSRLMVMLLIAAGFAGVQAQDVSSLESGLRALREGRYPEALEAFDRQKQLAPDDARPYFFSGLVLFRTGQQLQALQEMEKAVGLNPANGRYRVLYADLLFKSGFKFKALDALEPLKQKVETEKLSPEEIWIVQDIFFQLGRFEDAGNALSIYEGKAEAGDALYFRKAQLAMGMNRLDEALEAFQNALGKTDRKAEAFYGIGLIHYQTGDMESAADALAKAVELKPGHPEFAHLYASALLALRRPSEALEQLAQVENRAEEFPKIYDAMARSYRQLRDFQKAREYSEKFIQRDSAEKSQQGIQQKVHNLLQEGQKLLKEGDQAGAEARFRAVIDLDPDHYLGNNYLAGMYLLQRRFDQAYHHLKRMLKKNPDAFETNFLTAHYYYDLRRYREALRFGLKAKSIQPGYAELRNLLGNVYFALGENAKARQEYEAAMKLDPEKEAYRLNFESIPE